MKRPPGLGLILGGTAVAALAGYFVIWLVPIHIGLAAYKTFGLFWAAMYLVVGTLAGIQQEVTRGTTPRFGEDPGRASLARNFGVSGAGVVFLAVVATAPLWVSAVFPENGWQLVLPLAFAASSYVLVATLTGTLYGLSQWTPVALLVVVDALLRLSAVGILSVFTRDSVVLAWAAASPFLVTILILWPGFRSLVVGRATLDVDYRSLLWNVSRTMVAAASTGILVSGLPVVIGIAASEEPATLVASLFLAITITRAPVIVLVMSLQSYLLIRFRDRPATVYRTMFAILGILIVGGVLLGLAAWAVGPTVFDLLYGGRVALDGWLYGLLVVSSALVAALTVTGAAVLARSRHFAYSAGWVVAAVVTVISFSVPLGIIGQIVLAVIAGPAAGLLVHLGYLLAVRSQTRGARTQ